MARFSLTRASDHAEIATTHEQPAATSGRATQDLADNLILPALLFMALGAMTWAVRGSSGFGAVNGCIFAGVTWGTAWWFIAREPAAEQSRRYSSGWIVLALTIGIGIAGNRGWMQWPSFFDGRLQLDFSRGKFVPIPKIHGFLWLFIAGVPWAGLGACLLAWCAPRRRLTERDWMVRLCCGLGTALLARVLFESFPQFFLPLFKSLTAQYTDLDHNPNLRRLIGDNRAALIHLGCYLGFLGYEAARRDWKNVTLIATVGLLNGLGWALCQNWRWAPHLWPQANFNWWRCWESCGGISIGASYGLAYYLVNRPARPGEAQSATIVSTAAHPKLERLAVYFALVFGLGLSIKNGLKGWANLYLGYEKHWNRILWAVIGPAMLLISAGFTLAIRRTPKTVVKKEDLFPHAYPLVWLVLIIQNVIAQLVTGPYSVWNEMAFKIYYLLLMAISGVILHHFYQVKKAGLGRPTG
jgi:hypothetical protein